jgi:hypothetical protein
MRTVQRPSTAAPAGSAHALARATGGTLEVAEPGMTSITFPPPGAASDIPPAATIAAAPATPASSAPADPGAFLPFDTTPRTLSRAVEIDEVVVRANVENDNGDTTGQTENRNGNGSAAAGPRPLPPTPVDKQEIYEYVVDRLRRDALLERELLSKTIQDLY